MSELSKIRKFKVYLAGPISGRNKNEVHAWRSAVKRQFEEYLDFSDPN